MTECGCTPDLPDGRTGTECYQCKLERRVKDGIDTMEWLLEVTDMRTTSEETVYMADVRDLLTDVLDYLKYGGE